MLRRPGVDYDTIEAICLIAQPASATSRTALRAEFGLRLADDVVDQTQTAIKYSGYIDKQRDEVARALAYEEMALPDDLDFGQVSALSYEVRQKLAAQRPQTLGQASRISGVTPAAISLLLVHMKKRRLARSAAEPQTQPSDAA